MEAVCSIERTLAVLGERWTFLVLREAFFGRTRFAEFRDVLGVSTDVLSARLARLVEYGVLEKRAVPGAGLTAARQLPPDAAGRDLAVIMGALQQWGDEHLPRAEGPSVVRRTTAAGEPVDVGVRRRRGSGRAGARGRVHPGQLIRTSSSPSVTTSPGRSWRPRRVSGFAVDVHAAGLEQRLDLAARIDEVGELEQLAEADHAVAGGDLTAGHRRHTSGVEREAERIALEAFGVAGVATPLPGELDLNFRIGDVAVLKLHAVDADRYALALQDAVLTHLAGRGAPRLLGSSRRDVRR